MGSGASSGGKSTCTLFYNFNPDKAVVPQATLPIKQSDGTVNAPKDGCDAMVTRLRKSGPDSKELSAPYLITYLMNTQGRLTAERQRRPGDKTRWCFFNDSLTHEARFTFTVYDPKAAEGNPGVTPLCVPTPHGNATDAKNVKAGDSTTSANSAYIEIDENISVDDFRAIFPNTIPADQAEKLDRLNDNARVTEYFIALAPGGSIAVVDGNLKGYTLKVLIIPFNRKRSIAVVGRGLNAEAARKLRLEPGAVGSKSYTHSLLFLA